MFTLKRLNVAMHYMQRAVEARGGIIRFRSSGFKVFRVCLFSLGPVASTRSYVRLSERPMGCRFRVGRVGFRVGLGVRV